MRNRPVRGFHELLNETIVKVDASAINVVRFKLVSGKIVEIDCDEQHCGIGILQAKEQKK